jgi:uncharacterized protein YpuA (DUF1002 family)
MSQSNDTFNPFDPTDLVKGMRDSGMDAWSKTMIQLVNTDAYAQATGTMLDAWLTTSAPFRKAIEATTTRVLTSFNMPTRADVISLAERLTNIELRLDDLEAKLEEGQRAAREAAAGPRAKPRRTGNGGN